MKSVKVKNLLILFLLLSPIALVIVNYDYIEFHYLYDKLDVDNKVELISIDQSRDDVINLEVNTIYNGKERRFVTLSVEPVFSHDQSYYPEHSISLHFARVGIESHKLHVKSPCKSVYGCSAEGFYIKYYDIGDVQLTTEDLPQKPIYQRYFPNPIFWSDHSYEKRKFTKFERAKLHIDAVDHNNYKYAEQLLKEIIEEDPKFIDAYIQLARIEIIKSTRKGKESALRYLQAAISLNPDYADIYVLRGYIYTFIGRYSEADKDLTRARRLKSSSLWLDVNSAFLSYKKDDIESYKRYLVKVLSTSRDFTDNDRALDSAYEMYSNYLASQEKYEDTVKLLEQRADVFAQYFCYRIEAGFFNAAYLGRYRKAMELITNDIGYQCPKLKGLHHIENSYLASIYLANWFDDKLNGLNEEALYNIALQIDKRRDYTIYLFSKYSGLQKHLHALSREVYKINSDDRTEFSALQYAALDNDSKAVKILLSHGADPHLLYHKISAIKFALRNSNDETVRAFLISGKIRKQELDVESLEMLEKRNLLKNLI